MKLQQEITKLREAIASKVSNLDAIQLSDVLLSVNTIVDSTESVNQKMYKLYNEKKVLESCNETLHGRCNELLDSLRELKWERDRLRRKCADLEEYNQNVSESLKQRTIELGRLRKTKNDSVTRSLNSITLEQNQAF